MKRDIEEQFKSGRLKLTGWEKFSHYWFIGPILMLSFVSWYPEVFENDGYSGFPFGTILTLLVIVFFIYRQYAVLKFKKYAIKHTATHFKDAARATAIELSWIIEKLDESQLKANRSDLMRSWVGTRITIIRNNDKIFENSIVEPEIRSHPFSFGRNARNLDCFNSNLIQAVKGENVVQKAELEVKEAKEELENESEWNLKNTIKRIIIYLVIIVLMGASILILREQIHVLGIILLLICLGYITMDISILIKKRNKKHA